MRPLGPTQLLARSALYGFAGVAGKAAALLTVPFLARELGPQDYGLADLATSAAALLVLATSLSGDIPAAQRAGQAASRSERDMALRMYVAATLGVSLVVAVLLVPLSGVIAEQAWASPSSTGLALLALLLVPISAVQASLANVPRLLGNGRLFAGLSVVDLLGQLALAVLFVALGFGPTGVVLGFLVGSVFGLGAALWPARHIIFGEVRWSIAWQTVRDGARYLPALVLPLIADAVTRVVLANRMATADVGYFALAIRLASVMSLVAGAFIAAYGPDLLAKTYSSAAARAFGRTLTTYAGALIIASSLIALLAPEVVSIAAGSAYRNASLILPWLCAAGAAAGSYAALMLAAGFSDRAGAVAWTASVGAFAQVVLAVALVGPIGVMAAGVAPFVGQLLALTLLTVVLAPRFPHASKVLLMLYFGGLVTLAAVALIAMELPTGVRFSGAAVVATVGIVMAHRALRASRPDYPGTTSDAQKPRVR